MSVLVVFIDGIGLGAPDPAKNPFARQPLPALAALSGGPPLVHFTGSRPTEGGLAVALDACLGVDGLPQSATGQTALLTGVNAAARLGRHVSAFPPPSLLKILRADNLFMAARRHGQRPLFLNSFSTRYLKLLQSRANAQPPTPYRKGASSTPSKEKRRRRRIRPSATVAAVQAAGLPLLDEKDLAAGRALFHDVTGQWALPWMQAGNTEGVVVPDNVLTPQEAASVAVSALSRHDLVFFEHFLTDLVGHNRLDIDPEALITMLDEFLGAILERLPRDALLLVVSDHGNLEDLSTRVHTRNSVPLLAWGAKARDVADSAADLTDLFNVVGRALGWP